MAERGGDVTWRRRSLGGGPKRAAAAFGLSAAVLVIAVLAGCQAVRRPQLVPKDKVADVTGYARASITSPSSGPITVQLEGYREAGLAATIERLPPGPPIDCHEDVVLYRILFRPSPGAAANYEAVGHGCEGSVLVNENATSLVPRQDSHCALFDAVAEVLPSSASGTLDDRGSCKVPTKAREGAVDGELVREGGPEPGGPVPLPGLVSLSAVGPELSYLVSAGADGDFQAFVAPGTYSLTGRSPKVLSDGQEMECSAAHRVVVRSGARTNGLRVVCNVR